MWYTSFAYREGKNFRKVLEVSFLSLLFSGISYKICASKCCLLQKIFIEVNLGHVIIIFWGGLVYLERRRQNHRCWQGWYSFLFWFELVNFVASYPAMHLFWFFFFFLYIKKLIYHNLDIRCFWLLSFEFCHSKYGSKQFAYPLPKGRY